MCFSSVHLQMAFHLALYTALYTMLHTSQRMLCSDIQPTSGATTAGWAEEQAPAGGTTCGTQFFNNHR